jgi:hypothetical protein
MALIREENALRQQLYAPIYDLLKSDTSTRDMQAVLSKSRQQMRDRVAARVFKRGSDMPIPDLSDLGITIPTDSNDPTQMMVTNPYEFTAAWQTGAKSSSDQDGQLTTTMAPDLEGSAWAWAGVGFPLSPDQDRTYRMQPIFWCNYFYTLSGFWGFTTHVQGCVKIHAHRYDKDWQDTEEMEDYTQEIFSHTTETSFERLDPGMEVHQPMFFVSLRGDSNYLIWAAIELSGNCTFPYSSVQAYFDARCLDIWVNPPWP